MLYLAFLQLVYWYLVDVIDKKAFYSTQTRLKTVSLFFS